MTGMEMEVFFKRGMEGSLTIHYWISGGRCLVWVKEKQEVPTSLQLRGKGESN